MSNEAQNPASCQTAVSGSAFSIHDLKCGNILNYDTAEGEILPTVINWQDLKWITEDPKGFNLVHSPIELTNEILTKLGFQLFQSGYYCKNITSDNFYYTIGRVHDRELRFTMEGDGKALSTRLKVKYLHELQNLHYSLTGVMLSLS
jgi:hypothetical protein